MTQLTLVFASRNANKLKEIQGFLPEVRLISLDEAGIVDDIPEPGQTLEENALYKARYVYEKCGLSVFADDSGLEVAYLNGEPGVCSARYAGPQRSDEDNMDLLLRRLPAEVSRSAAFKTVIALILNGEEHVFNGEVPGSILHEKRGNQGFGYDPLFVPDGHHRTFAEMSLDEKKALSHRTRAVKQMVSFIQGKLK